MSWTTFGFNFRATSGYVTDGPDEVYVAGDVYPTTRSTSNGNSATFGWLTAPDGSRDRDSGIDRRLAGINFANNVVDFQIDLPSSGEHEIVVAAGDTGGNNDGDYVLLDNATTIASFDEVGGINGWFADAMGTSHAEDDWPSNQVPRTHTFTSTTFVYRLNHDGDRANTVVAHVALTSTGSTGINPAVAAYYNHLLQGAA